MSNESVVLSFVSETSGAIKGVKNLTGSFSTLQKKGTVSWGAVTSAIKRTNANIVNINKDANRTNATFGSLSKTFGGFNSIAAMLPIAAISNFFANGMKMAVSAIETQNLFSVALGNSAESANNFAKRMSAATGMNLTSIQSAIGTFALLGKSMNMASDQAEKMAINSTIMALDIASLTNVSFEQALGDVKSGLVGQSETVYKYGLDLTEAGLKAEALAQGIDKSTRAMSQGEKMALRSALMARVLTKDLGSGVGVVGDFTRTLNQPANLVKILTEKIKTLSIAIGNAFIPIMAKVLPYLIAFVEILIDAANAIAAFLGYSDAKFGTEFGKGVSLEPIKDDAEDATGAIGDTNDAVKKLKKSMLGIDELNIMSKPEASQSSGGGGGAEGFGDSIIDKIKLPDLSPLYDSMSNTSKELKEKLIPYLQTAAVVIGVILGLVAAFKTVNGVANLATSFGVLNKAIAPLATTLGISTLSALAGIALIIGGLIVSVAGFAMILNESQPTFEAFFTTLAGIALIAAGVGLIFGAIPALITLLIGVVLMAVVYLVKYWDEISAAFITGWNWLLEQVTQIGNNIAKFFSDLWTNITTTVTTIWNNLITFFTTTIPQFIGGIITWFSELPTKIAEFFNMVVTNAVNFLGSLWTTITTEVPKIISGIITWFSELPEKLAYVFGLMLGNSVKFWVSMWTNITVEVPKIINGIVTWFMGLKDKVFLILATLILNFKTGWDNIVSGVASFLSTIATNFQTGWNTLVDGIKSFLESLVTNFQTGLDTVISGITTFFSNLVTNFQTGWTTIVEGLSQFGEDFLEFFANLPENIKQCIEDNLTTIQNIGKYIIDGIIAGVGNIAKKAGDVANSFVKGFKDALGIKSPSKVMEKDVGHWLGLGIGVGLEKTTSSIVGTATDIADGIQGAFDNVTGVDSKNLIPTNLGEVDVGTVSMTNKIQTVSDATKNVSAMDDAYTEMSNIISSGNSNNKGDTVVNMYVDGVYDGTAKTMDRKNIKAGKVVYTLGG